MMKLEKEKTAPSFGGAVLIWCRFLRSLVGTTTMMKVGLWLVVGLLKSDDGILLIASGAIEADSIFVRKSSFSPVDADHRKYSNRRAEPPLEEIFRTKIREDVFSQTHAEQFTLATREMRETKYEIDVFELYCLHAIF